MCFIKTWVIKRPRLMDIGVIISFKAIRMRLLNAVRIK